MKTLKQLICVAVVLCMAFSITAPCFAVDISKLFGATDEEKLNELYSTWDIIDDYEPKVLAKSNDDSVILSNMYEYIKGLDTVKKVVWESDYHFSFKLDTGLWSEYHRFSRIGSADSKAIDDVISEYDSIKSGDPTNIGSYTIGVYSPYYGSDSSMTQNYLEAANAMAAKVDDATVESWYGTGYSWSTGAGNVESFKNFGRYGFVIVDSHGSASSATGKSYIWCPSPGTYDQQDVADGHLLYSGGDIGVSGTYIEKYCTLQNCFVYLGICEGMKQLGTAEALLNAGCGFVCGYTESVTFYYDGLMMPTVCDAFVTVSETDSSRTNTALETCQYARSVHGDVDTYGDAVLIWRGNDNLTWNSAKIPVTGVELVQNNVELYNNNSFAFSYTTTPENANSYTVNWTCDDSSVATIDEATGIVTAVAEGITNIRLTLTNNIEDDENFGETYTAIGSVSVLGEKLAHGVAMTTRAVDTYLGDTNCSVSAEVLPMNASNRGISFVSENPEIATVDINGSITPMSLGTTRIIATSEDGDFCDYAVIRVLDLIGIISADNNSLVFTNNSRHAWTICNVDNRPCGKSGNSSQGSTESKLSLAITMNAGDMLSFDYRVSSEINYDLFSFTVNGTSRLSDISGEVPWSTYTYTATGSGSYTFAWTYAKDSSVDDGEDCAYIDNVCWTDNATIDIPGSLYYSEYFEGDTSSLDWTCNDIDENGYGWCLDNAQNIAYDGNGLMTSRSYIAGIDSQSTNNEMSSPIISIPENIDSATLSFFACAAYPYYANEQFEVYVIDASNNTRTKIGQDSATCVYTQYTYDMIGYAGMDITIVIAHTDSNGASALNFDTVELYVDTADIETFTLNYTLDGAEYLKQTFLAGAKLSQIADVEEDGKAFGGWIGMPEVMPEADVSVAGSMYDDCHTVTYIDGFTEEVIASRRIKDGSSVTFFPTTPLHVGYTMLGWLGNGSNVTDDITLTANFAIPSDKTVTFVDGLTSEIISTQTVAYGGSVDFPNAPEHEGYTFSQWDHSGLDITADITITALYDINMYTVTFADGLTDEIISQVQVAHGDNAVLPEPPVHDGYEFVAWDFSNENITSDITITAMYRLQTEIGDINGDDVVNTGDAVFILRYVVGTVEIDIETDALRIADHNGDGAVNTGDAVSILRYCVA